MLDHISLKSYRNLNLSTNLDSQGNLIIATNGSGKSNFLESIYFGTLGKSYKPLLHRKEIIAHDSDFSRLVLKFDTQEVESVVANGQTKFSLNGKRQSISKLSGKFPVIIFAPHSVDLVSSDPASRRSDIDDFLSLMSDEYAQTITKYKKIIKNRNALLKNIRDYSTARDQLRYWTSETVKLATTLFSFRSNYFQEIIPFLEESASQLYGDKAGSFSISYEPNIVSNEGTNEEYSQHLSQKYQENEEKEIIVGQTLYGPHKDDYSLFLNDENLRYLGSRGQQRLSVFIWKLAQHQYLHNRTGHYPLFLIDDLLSELDEHHRNMCADYLLSRDWQYILTSADQREVPSQLKENTNRIKLNGDI